MKSEKIKLFSIFLLCGSNFGTNLYADSSTNLDTNLSQAKLSDIVVTATKNPIKIAQVPRKCRHRYKRRYQSKSSYDRRL